MKKLVLSFALVASLSVWADLKIGTVDMMSLVRNHPNYDVNKNLLQTTEKDYQARVNAMKEELDKIQEEGTKLSKEYQNPMLAQTAKTKLEKDISSIQNRYLAQQRKMRDEVMHNQQELSDLEARLLKSQADDIKKHIENFAKKNDYDMVIDKAAAVYARENMDVTMGVLKEMGVSEAKVAERKAQDEGK